MASHDLSNTKPTILGATPGVIPGIYGNPHEIFSFAPAFSERFFENWGGPRAPDLMNSSRSTPNFQFWGTPGSGPEKGVITKGVFSLEKSLESLKSLDSLESLENCRSLLCFPHSGGSLETLKSLNSLESLENALF